MMYNDEALLSIPAYEVMAKAYRDSLKKEGFIFVKVDNEKNKQLTDELFSLLAKIKGCLFVMGGFLGTSPLYSLNERQIKKLAIIFDRSPELNPPRMKYDKTTCLLRLIGYEASLTNLLLELSELSPYETELRSILTARLNLISQIFNR